MENILKIEEKIMKLKYTMDYRKNIRYIKLKEKEIREELKSTVYNVPFLKKIKFLICIISFDLYFYIRKLKFVFLELYYIILYGSVGFQMFYIRDDKKIIYVTNSKVACTSVKASFFEMKLQKDYMTVHDVADKNFLRRKLSKRYKNYKIFSFTRNPYRRLIACYENKYHSDRKYLGKSIYELRFDNYLFGYLKEDQGFAKFAEKVARIPDFLADVHFKSQYATLYIKGRGLPDYIGKFENLTEDFEPLRQKYDLAPLPHYNSTAKERSAENWMDYYDLHTAELVYKRYKKDFEVFGYEDEYHKLIAYLKAKEA